MYQFLVGEFDLKKFDGVSRQNLGSSGIWTRDLSHPKRESYP